MRVPSLRTMDGRVGSSERSYARPRDTASARNVSIVLVTTRRMSQAYQVHQGEQTALVSCHWRCTQLLRSVDGHTLDSSRTMPALSLDTSRMLFMM